MRIDLLGQDAANALPYSLEQFEQDVQGFKPRVFDTYILPAFMMYYAVKSKGMRKVARRILFTSGIYMMYRNYSEYKKAFAKMQAALSVAKGEAAT
jgi:hypothetical protein